jgi:two-component system, OmpR family, alkaline phosphatase synthesis response regulator PhoP
MNILIAEDELQNQKLLQKIFTNMGFKSTIMESGEEILATSDKYDILILDLILTDMDGIDIAKAIRSGKSYQSVNLPIVLLSGKSKELMQSYCKDYAINDYIQKPFGLDEIKTKINSLLGL